MGMNERKHPEITVEKIYLDVSGRNRSCQAPESHSDHTAVLRLSRVGASVPTPGFIGRDYVQDREAEFIRAFEDRVLYIP